MLLARLEPVFGFLEWGRGFFSLIPLLQSSIEKGANITFLIDDCVFLLRVYDVAHASLLCALPDKTLIGSHKVSELATSDRVLPGFTSVLQITTAGTRPIANSQHRSSHRGGKGEVFCLVVIESTSARCY